LTFDLLTLAVSEE